MLELAAEWTRMGLLGPALWVRPEQVRRARSGPPRIGATILLLDGEHRLQNVEVDVFESLAQQSLTLVRLVKLRSAVPSREVDEEQDEIAGLMGDYLTKAMPMAVPTASIADQTTDLSRLTLICAPTEFQLQQRVDWAASEYGTVVVASPEDRASPWSGDAFVRDDDRFVGFALMHLASIAGLWSGVGIGTFELVPREASSNQSVWVSRVFLNAIITEALGRRTAALVLEHVGRADSVIIDPSTGSPPSGTAFIDEELISAYVEQMVEASMSLDHGALSFSPVPPEEHPQRDRIGIIAQVKSFIVFGLDKYLMMPKWVWRWLTSRAARELTKRLQSDDGTHIVGDDYDAILDARDARLIARRDEIFAAERNARAALTAPAGISRLRTTPRLWARLRELVFGALDGSSDLSDLGFASIEGKVPVFGRVSDVFPAPDEVWNVDGGPEGLPLPIDWHTLAQHDPREVLIPWMQEAQSDAYASRDAASDGGGAANDEPAATGAADAERVRREEAVHDYDTWAAARDRSFVWRLCARLAEDRAAAQEAVERYAREIEELAVPAPGEIVRLRKKFHRRLLASWGSMGTITGGLLAFLSLFSGIGALLQVLAPWFPGPAILVGVAIVAAVTLSSGALAAYHRGWSSFQRRVDLVEAHLTYVADASRHARRELARMSSLHRQTIDWLDLLARAIHHPWRIRPEWLARPDYEIAKDSLPFAMTIGTVVESDHAAATRLRRVTTEHLVRRGWRAEAFHDLVREVGGELGHDGVAFAVDALDDDLPHSSNNTRRMLRETMRRESVQTRVAALRLRSLVTEIQRHALHRSTPRVAPIDDDLLDPLAALTDPLGLDEGEAWDDFLLASLAGRREPVTPLSTGWLSAGDVQERYHEHVTSYLLLPERLDALLDYSDDPAVSTVALQGEGRSSLDLVWRADVVGPLPIGAIALWSGVRGAVGNADDTARQSSGV